MEMVVAVVTVVGLALFVGLVVHFLVGTRPQMGEEE